MGNIFYLFIEKCCNKDLKHETFELKMNILTNFDKFDIFLILFFLTFLGGQRTPGGNVANDVPDF